MSKNYFILFALLLIPLFGFAQKNKFKKPNYKKISKKISKENSNYYYPKLMERFLEADSTMNLKEKRHLYYGFAFQDEYSPYGSSSFTDSLNSLFEIEIFQESDYKNMARFCDSILFDNPFDLKAINYQLFALDHLGQYESFNNNIVRMEIILDALFSSGDGKSKRTAYYVINTSHEYHILEILGYQFGGTQSLIGQHDYLTVVENENNIEGLYFDVSVCLNALHNMFKK